jgi:hypothetical protein
MKKPVSIGTFGSELAEQPGASREGIGQKSGKSRVHAIDYPGKWR